MVITFRAIFVPKDNLRSPNSYFIVDAQTYKNTIGFSPVTYNEYFGVHNDKIEIGNRYLNQDYYFTDRVDMYTYELIYSDMFNTKQRDKIMEMVQTLETNARITRVSMELEVNNAFLDEEELKKREVEIGDKVRIRTDLLSKAYSGILFNRPLMQKYEGAITTVTNIKVKDRKKFIKLEVDNERFTWGEDMLVKIIEGDKE